MEITIGSKYRIRRFNQKPYIPIYKHAPEGTIVQVLKCGLSADTLCVQNLDGTGREWYCHKGRLAPATPEDPYAETDF